MEITTSRMLELRADAPEFQLKNVLTGEVCSLDDFEEKSALLLIFLAPSCSYSQHVHEGVAQLGRDYLTKGVGIVAICPNDPQVSPGDSLDNLRILASSLPFPLLFDEEQEVAKSCHAACTPEYLLFDGDLKLVYRGRFDDSEPMNDRPVTGKALRRAIDIVLENPGLMATGILAPGQVPSIGCSIKWKKGNTPDYIIATEAHAE